MAKSGVGWGVRGQKHVFVTKIGLPFRAPFHFFAEEDFSDAGGGVGRPPLGRAPNCPPPPSPLGSASNGPFCRNCARWIVGDRPRLAVHWAAAGPCLKWPLQSHGGWAWAATPDREQPGPMARVRAHPSRPAVHYRWGHAGPSTTPVHVGAMGCPPPPPPTCPLVTPVPW